MSMDKYISLDDAVEAVAFHPAYTERLRACPSVLDKMDREIYTLQAGMTVDENIIKTAEECGELMQALSKWRDVMNDFESQPYEWQEANRLVLEELVDVIIMTRIVRVMCGLNPDMVWDQYDRKMQRNLSRLKAKGDKSND